ncbi:MAG TPA: SPOR domain-containing protein [Blastocatellia bacterium]|nr:SPOR domain-containing protein [Blastocatellia bacterium]
MQLEMTNTICPLCRRMVQANGLPLATRLCVDCQTLVHTIVPSGNLPVAAALPQGPGFFDDILEHDRDEIASEALASEAAEQPEPVEEDYQPFYIDQEPEPGDEEEEYDLDDTMEQPARDTGPLDEPPFYEEPPQATQASDPSEQAQSYDLAVQDYETEPATDVEGEGHAASADPWEEPLPAWEYSRNEWPLTAGVAQQAKKTSYRKPMIIALVLAGAIGLYYFVFRPSAEEGQSPNTRVAPASGGAATSDASQNPAATETAEPDQASSQPATEEDSVETRPVATEAPSADATPADGAYTLQVAALPDEASAREYSERLMRAGISTYIVPVQSGRRKFFRVRVGRFKTAEDAQKYAAQSRLRARAAGMSLDFLVVEYAK